MFLEIDSFLFSWSFPISSLTLALFSSLFLSLCSAFFSSSVGVSLSATLSDSDCLVSFFPYNLGPRWSCRKESQASGTFYNGEQLQDSRFGWWHTAISSNTSSSLPKLSLLQSMGVFSRDLPSVTKSDISLEAFLGLEVNRVEMVVFSYWALTSWPTVLQISLIGELTFNLPSFTPSSWIFR